MGKKSGIEGGGRATRGEEGEESLALGAVAPVGETDKITPKQRRAQNGERKATQRAAEELALRGNGAEEAPAAAVSNTPAPTADSDLATFAANAVDQQRKLREAAAADSPEEVEAPSGEVTPFAAAVAEAEARLAAFPRNSRNPEVRKLRQQLIDLQILKEEAKKDGPVDDVYLGLDSQRRKHGFVPGGTKREFAKRQEAFVNEISSALEALNQVPPSKTPATEATPKKAAPKKRTPREEPPAWDGDIPTTEANTPNEDVPVNTPEKTPRKQPLKAEAAAVEVPGKTEREESVEYADILKTWGIMPEPTAATKAAPETKVAPDSAPVETNPAPRTEKTPEAAGRPLTVEEWVEQYSVPPNPYEERIAEMMQYGSKNRGDAIATINDTETKNNERATLAEAAEKNRLALEEQIKGFTELGASPEQARAIIEATDVYTQGGGVEAAAQTLESGAAPAEAIPPQPEMTPEQKELLIQRLGAATDRAEIIISSAPAKHREWVKKNLSSLDAQLNKAADWYNRQNLATKLALGGGLATVGMVGVVSGGWLGATVAGVTYLGGRGLGYLGALTMIDAVQKKLKPERTTWKGGAVKHAGALAFAVFMPSLVQYADQQVGASKLVREYVSDWFGGDKGGKSTASEIQSMTSDNFDVPKDPNPINPLLTGDERPTLEGALSQQEFSDPAIIDIPPGDANDIPLSKEPPPVTTAEFGSREVQPMTSDNFDVPRDEVRASKGIEPMTSDNFDVGVDRNPGGTVFTEPPAELVRYFNEPVTVKPGDNVWNIIQNKLGPNGSAADVLARVEFLKSLSQWQQDSMGLGKWDNRIQGWNIMPGTVLHLDVLDVMPQPKGGGVAATVIEQSRAIPPTESPAPAETVKSTGPTLIATEARVRAEMYQRFKSNGIFGIGKTDGSMLYNVVREVPVGEFMPLAQPDHRGFSQLQKLDGAHYAEMRKYITEQMTAMKRAGVATAGFEKLKLEEFARKVAEFRITLPR